MTASAGSGGGALLNMFVGRLPGLDEYDDFVREVALPGARDEDRRRMLILCVAIRADVVGRRRPPYASLMEIGALFTLADR